MKICNLSHQQKMNIQKSLPKNPEKLTHDANYP